MSRFISFDASLNFCSSSLFPIVWHHARTHACASTQRAEEGGRRMEVEEEEEEMVVVEERRRKEQGGRRKEEGARRITEARCCVSLLSLGPRPHRTCHQCCSTGMQF